MKRYLLLLSVFIIGLSSCKKGDVTADQAAVDEAKILAFIKANNITATKDPSGVYYQIITPGTGAHPIATSSIQVTYNARFLNGVSFDGADVITLKLSSLVKGWQIAIPKIGQHGRINFIVPSALAYGTTATSTVPANSVLSFTVELVGSN
jgi:FKBP-type peptidyl-prolyl cis-trans isomerase FkpA